MHGLEDDIVHAANNEISRQPRLDHACVYDDQGPIGALQQFQNERVTVLFRHSQVRDYNVVTFFHGHSGGFVTILRSLTIKALFFEFGGHQLAKSRFVIDDERDQFSFRHCLTPQDEPAW